MIKGKNLLVTEVYWLARAFDHPEDIRLVSFVELETCLDRYRLRLNSPRTPTISQDSKWWRKCFL